MDMNADNYDASATEACGDCCCTYSGADFVEGFCSVVVIPWTPYYTNAPTTPTKEPSAPTTTPTDSPTTSEPSKSPTKEPTKSPTEFITPTKLPTTTPTDSPTTSEPSKSPTWMPSLSPTWSPTKESPCTDDDQDHCANIFTMPVRFADCAARCAELAVPATERCEADARP